MATYFTEDGSTSDFTDLIDLFQERAEAVAMALAAHEEDDPSFKTHRVEPLISLVEEFLHTSKTVLDYAQV